ncbi:MAG: helix-turn-helix domain-containing protein [Thermodesulfobacteriota bacterium]
MEANVSIDGQHLSYGRYLQHCRRERGLRLEDLSRELKITFDMVMAIENEDYARFPDEVFTKGFLRAFARAVGADGDRVVQGYLSQVATFRDSITAEAAIVQENRLFWKRAVASSAVLALLIGMTLLLMPDGRENQPVGTESLPAAENSVPATSETREEIEEEVLQRQMAAKEPSPPVRQGKMLDIVTIEDTWVKIITDNDPPKEYSLKAGDRLALEAKERFNLLIGNAAGIQLFVDKTPMTLQGEKGQVINIEIP